MSQALKYTAIPILSSNYVWAISHSNLNECYIVDPGRAEAVIQYLEETQQQLIGILITHSHNDHIGGINALLKHSPAPVIGPDCQAIPQITVTKGEGDCFELWPGYEASVMHVPGHLPEHIIYLIQSEDESDALMCGDIIFSSGCGKMFSGPAPAYHGSLQRIAALKPDTRLYCAHEYTLTNVNFALSIEKNNQDLQDKLRLTKLARDQGSPTLPSTLENELKTNPFLRCNRPEIIETLSQLSGQNVDGAIQAFALLRQMKDNF